MSERERDPERDKDTVLDTGLDGRVEAHRGLWGQIETAGTREKELTRARWQGASATQDKGSGRERGLEREGEGERESERACV